MPCCGCRDLIRGCQSRCDAWRCAFRAALGQHSARSGSRRRKIPTHVTLARSITIDTQRSRRQPRRTAPAFYTHLGLYTPHHISQLHICGILQYTHTCIQHICTPAFIGATHIITSYSYSFACFLPRLYYIYSPTLALARSLKDLFCLLSGRDSCILCVWVRSRQGFGEKELGRC